MIKVLTKSFALLEIIAAYPEKETPLAEIAEKAGVNKATATRILKCLLDAGYVDQTASRKGYTLGPMSHYLASRGVYRKDLIAASTNIVAQAAKDCGGAALIAVLRAGRRFVLNHSNGNPEFEVFIQDTFYDDLYWTATGKMLLAYAQEDEIRSYVRTHGLPGDMWDGIDTEEKLRSRLEAIRNDGLLSYSRTNMGLSLYSFPIFFKGRFEAVLGLCLPFGAQVRESHEQYLTIGHETVRHIESALAANTGKRTLIS